MPDLYVDYWPLGGGDKCSTAIWSEGPKAGQKWVTGPTYAGRPKLVLIRKARRGEAHIGQWVEIEP